MRTSAAALGVVVAACCSASGCASPPHEPLELRAPWADGEETTYDHVGATSVDTWVHRFERKDGAWSLAYSEGDAPAAGRGTIVLGDDGAPASAHHHGGDVDLDVVYGGAQIVVKRTNAGKAQADATSARYPDTLDAEELWPALRGLAFAPGLERHFMFFAPAADASKPISVTVVGTETVTVPAGTFDAWHVKLMIGDLRDVWYAREPPHWMLKEVRPSTGSELRLRSYRLSGDAQVVESAAPKPLPPPPPKVDVGYVLCSFLVQAPLAMLLPLALAYFAVRRLGGSIRALLFGVASFIGSQVVHIPLNYATGLIGGRPPLGTLAWLPLSIVVGLSAGLCEELARLVAMRFALKKARGWSHGVAFGVGHGGIESMLLAGALPMLGLVNVLLAPLSAAGRAPAVEAQIHAYWAAAHWWLPIYAGVERVGAIAFHVGASVFVMRAVTRRNPAWLLLAIAIHAALDGAVVAMKVNGLPDSLLEATGIFLGLSTLALAIALRERPAAAAAAAAAAA